jgi:desumoylating isopeptidase 1
MDVQLYVYDLSQGLARQFSMTLLGTHIDAVYHTSIVFEGVEYFYGQGIQTCSAGGTHHGRPMEIINLGQTSLPIEVILEYLESMKDIYSAESYDLFLHNCNNFSNDFAMFLVGKGIPNHITSLPQTVMNTPFGQMLRPQIDGAMRQITQAPVPSPPTTAMHRSADSGSVANGSAHFNPTLSGKVQNVTSLSDIEQLLASASDKCACIFFTSSTCAPCKLVYGDYDELAQEAGDKAMLIKVDINYAQEAASKYNIRATPTFITFLRNEKQEEWSGADPSRLRGTIHLLIQQAFPQHPHYKLSLPNFLSTSLKPATFTKCPPLDKLIAKIGSRSEEPAIKSMTSFIKTRDISGAREAPLPNKLVEFSYYLQDSKLPPETLFPIIDLLRVSLVDPRVSGFFCESPHLKTIYHILSHVNSLKSCPYSLRLVTLQMSCNLFTSPLFRIRALVSSSESSETNISSAITTLLTTSLLDDAHPQTRVAASSLAFNISSSIHRARTNSTTSNEEPLRPDDQVELLASLLEAVGAEKESKQAVKALILAIGYLVYYAPLDGEVMDLCKVMDASGIVCGKKEMMKDTTTGEMALVREVGEVLLGKGVSA